MPAMIHPPRHEDEAPPHAAAERLPVAALLALATTGFIAILTETLPAGLLPQIGAGLQVSSALAGQTVTLYAVGSLAASLPLTAALQGWRRRPVLLLAIAGFLVFNSVTAFSSHYVLTLVARFFAGTAAGLAWGIIAGYARRMVTGPLQGRALALAMVGTPVALLGVPAGAFLGAHAGWRLTFWLVSLLTLGLTGWVCWAVPDFPGVAAGQRLSVRRVFVLPGIRPVLLVIFLWMTAHNVLYTYVAPFLAAVGPGIRVDMALMDFGVAALAGIWIVGRLVDRWLRALGLLSLGGFALAAVALGLGGGLSLVIYPAVAVWGLKFAGAATLLGTASADAAGEGVDLAQALVTTVWNLAVAIGGLLGGALLARCGTVSFPPVVFGTTVLAGWMAWRAKTYGFPPGCRPSS